MSAITAKASRKMKKYAVLTREPRCFLGSFDFSWEQRKAKELFVSTADKGYPELPVLSATQDRGMIRRDENSINIFHDKKNEAGYKRVLPGQFVIHLRSFQGGFAHSAIEGITSPAYTVFGFSEPEKHDSEYWKYVFTSKSFIRRLETVTYGIRDGRSISYDEFLTLGFVYPSKAEQTAIARYLDKLSDLITLHQRKCANLCSPSQVVFSLLFATSTFSWEQRKVGDLIEDYIEKTIVQNQYPVLTSSQQQGIVLQEDYFADRQVTTNDNIGYYVLPRGYFTYRSRSDTDMFVFNRNNIINKGIISYYYPVFLPKNCDSNFLLRRLNHGIRKQLSMAAEGTGQKVLAHNKFKNMVVDVPSTTEQCRIGIIFEMLDHLITLHQRECISFTGRADRLILTANKKRTTSSWEQRKLGDVGETYTGLSGKTKADFGHGQARFITYMNVFSNPISNPEMTEPIEIDPKQNEVEVGDVFFTTSSETPEEVGMSSVLFEKRGKIYLNSFCFGFRPTEKIDSYYLAYMLRSESAREKIILLAQGISRYNISKNKVMEIAVSLPSLDEQKLIGQYFRQLDNLITLHQRKPFLMKWRTSDANRKQTNRLVL